MEFKTFECSEDDSGRRLDRVCQALLKGTGVNVQEALRKSLLKLGGKKARGSDRVKKGDIITAAAFFFENVKEKDKNEECVNKKVLKNIQLDIIYRNDNLCFINKPKGMKSQGSISEDCVSTFARNLEVKGSLSFIPAPLHRLDRYTSGLMAVSLSMEGARTFSLMLKERSVRKIYAAVVEGSLESSFFLEDFITGSDAENGFYTVKDDISKKAENRALTRITPLSYGNYEGRKVTLIQAEILTGKKHQIRFQCAKKGFPLLGDTAYGGKKGPFLLHSALMIFENSGLLNRPCMIKAPFPEECDSFIKQNLKIQSADFIL